MKFSSLFKRGAEASLFLTQWEDRRVIIKKRLPKKYRPPTLDKQIRTYRTIHEPQLMHAAKQAGVPTPLIYQVNVKEGTIIMQFVEGKQVKELLNIQSEKERKRTCLRIGKSIGRLHKSGIIHGDLTTSNMIVDPEKRIVFVDFGLGEKTNELEAKAVDLHLMKRALQSTHYRVAQECFNTVIEGYSSALGTETAKEVLGKIEEIEKRGRYVTERRT
ncbi:MAG TPA: Kae1-associated kinase Bud32 [Candidatus Acidoferrum sp.]|nr:Kae1-associated kinase Bud32 [Candidatus Acidoferrum sp.]